MKLTAELLKEKGFVELASGNWAKGGIGDNLEIIKAEIVAKPPKRIRQSSKPLNQTEQRYKERMIAQGITDIREQAITLKLDPPFKSYRADLSYVTMHNSLCLVEVKGPHRFRRAGIAKVALAAKTYPEFAFLLAEWDGKEWKETGL